MNDIGYNKKKGDDEVAKQTLKKVTVNDCFIEVSEENADEFQQNIDTLIILFRVMGLNVDIHQYNNAFTIYATGDASVPCSVSFSLDNDFFSMDCVCKLPYLDVNVLRQELLQEGYSQYVYKRLGGVRINGMQSSDLEKCMISCLKKLQTKT